MFSDQNKINNAKLLNLANALENKDQYLHKMKIRLYVSIAQLSVICIASIICTVINVSLMIPIFITSASVYLIASLILIKNKLIDIEHVVIIGMIYILLYLDVSSMLVGLS